jgi:hypothetical protein
MGRRSRNVLDREPRAQRVLDETLGCRSHPATIARAGSVLVERLFGGETVFASVTHAVIETGIF